MAKKKTLLQTMRGKEGRKKGAPMVRGGEWGRGKKKHVLPVYYLPLGRKGGGEKREK